MPRDDLSIDFVRKMPPAAELDPALILDEWIHNTQNLPEEIRFMQDEIAEKDRQYDKLVKEIDKNDERIQKFIKANGSFHPNPKEEEYRQTILKNFDLAEQLSKEKLELTRKLQHTFDKHLRALDKQIKSLYDRGEPGFTDPDELPSLVRDSAANITSTPTVLRPVNGNHPISSALNGLANGTGPNAARSNQIRNIQASHHHSASAPATPAATIILNQRARESSAGPGGAARKGAVRSNSGLNLQTSGIGRHSSLGPGTPKSSTASGGVQRAGSAGPRGTGKGSISSTSRKSVPSGSSAASRKKGSSAPTAGSGSGAGGGASANGTSGSGAGGGSGSHKSNLSRVLKRAGTGTSGSGAKNSPNSTSRANSTGDSDLSDADSNLSGSESDHRRIGTGRNTPIGGGGSHSRSASHHHTSSSFSHKGGDDPNHPHHHPGHHPSSSLASNNGSGLGGPGGHFPGRPLPTPSLHNPHQSSHNRNRSHHQLQEMHRSPSLSGHNPDDNPGLSDDDAMDLDDNMDLDDEEAGDDRKYCLCQNVSFGDMVACDNDECPYEWFHWSCVGLKSEPNGTWYCPVCAKNMEREGGRELGKKGSQGGGGNSSSQGGGEGGGGQ
ncbi:inhibitor of growth proteins N-terminal histone-binding-domain-containing protein [Neurospora tetraspora]|uniref:Chromatin modification-related protein n=1 Tax=Neurospora tetraspora TaxID=94610 RepID=A0AAE0JQY1_9PEZI|nr:inhibitor of growth proteins N-terminal histone-binding-domain-containing protein [Neurospora tetraspora]